MAKVRVVLADDSAFMRKKLRDILVEDDTIEVVGSARDGFEVVEMTKRFKPDVVTMDINMPGQDGITALQIIMTDCPTPVVMLSSLTQKGALTTFECLELGAFDYIGKPSGTISHDLEEKARLIRSKVKLAARSKVTPTFKKTPFAKKFAPTEVRIEKKSEAAKTSPGSNNSGVKHAERVVVIGVSTGGPLSLMEVVPLLPHDLDAAVVIVQHMPEAFTGSFAQRLNNASNISFKEAENGDPVLAGHGYLARGGKHLTFRPAVGSEKGVFLRTSSIPRDSLHTPSVDVMMFSAVQQFGANIVGVLLTGMGADGADAMVKIRQTGGKTIAESEETAIVFGMPAQAIERGGADYVLHLQKIASAIEACVTAVKFKTIPNFNFNKAG